MKLVNVVLSQVVQLVKITYPAGSIYLPELVQGLSSRYGFLEVPKGLAEYDAEKGIVFSHGKFITSQYESLPLKTDIAIIDRLAMFNDGVIVETRSSIEHAELFLSDLLEWGTQEFNLTIHNVDRTRGAFTSRLEIEMNPEFLEKMKFTQVITDEIFRRMDNSGQKPLQYLVTGFNLNFDAFGMGRIPPIPSVFQLDRRAGNAFASNLFFSAAPLRTRDHLDLLAMIERE